MTIAVSGRGYSDTEVIGPPVFFLLLQVERGRRSRQPGTGCQLKIDEHIITVKEKINCALDGWYENEMWSPDRVPRLGRGTKMWNKSDVSGYLPTLHNRVMSAAASHLSSEKPMARLRCEVPEAQPPPLYRLIRPPICPDLRHRDPREIWREKKNCKKKPRLSLLVVRGCLRVWDPLTTYRIKWVVDCQQGDFIMGEKYGTSSHGSHVAFCSDLRCPYGESPWAARQRQLRLLKGRKGGR
jgi:hypothetical protein